MLWEEDNNESNLLTSEVTDVSFRIQCKTIPLDHLHTLSSAVGRILPWLKDEEHAGLHLIHGAESGNGWMRPEDVSSEVLHLSHRARMAVRVPLHRLDDVKMLTGKTIDIAGHSLSVGESTLKPLPPYGTLFSRYVICDPQVDEETFLEVTISEIARIDIQLHKILCGKTHVFATPDGPLHTRSIMFAGLKPTNSLKLQEFGVGPGRHCGCGLFIPHKGIEAVNKQVDD